MTNNNRRVLAAECLGTAFLLSAVVGSGIMAHDLSDGNTAVALLGNTLPTGAILVVLILALGPVSGGHFNPIVSLVFLMGRQISASQFVYYIVAQFIGATIGVLVANAMFDLTLISFYTIPRSGFGQLISEIVASFGLVSTILATVRRGVSVVAPSVGLYIIAAYWFTASTSFANPAARLSRGLTSTFSGIRLIDIPMFIIAQVIGALLSFYLVRWFQKSAAN